MLQLRLDIFFIDWERGVRADGGDDMATSPVSVWRKLFVTNKWNELQVQRLLNVPLTLLMMVFLLRGVGLEYLGTAQPSKEATRTWDVYVSDACHV